MLFISSQKLFSFLRYYATFKVRKFESLFYKINSCFRKTTACIGLRAEQSWQSIKGKSFIVQNYTENANGYGPLTVENV